MPKSSRLVALAALLALTGCVAPVGPVEVTRFHLPDTTRLGRATIAVEPAPGMAGDSLEFRSFAAAVARELGRLGYSEQMPAASQQVALVRLERHSYRPERGRGPVSVGVGGATGSYGSGVGLGIGFGCVVVASAILRAKHARDQARIAKAEAERNQLEKNVLEARLQLMQAQVEPHFLFNTLANVQHLVETDAAAASRMLDSLIQYLRAALPQMREGTTTLGRELARLELTSEPVQLEGLRTFIVELTPEQVQRVLDLPMVAAARLNHTHRKPRDARG